MELLEEIKAILTDLLDLEDPMITPETYIIRELGAESIDLLELSITLNSRFKIKVDDNELFLTRLRTQIMQAKEEDKEIISYLTDKHPFLSKERVAEILADLDFGPVTKVKDVISYIEWARKNGE